MHEANFLLRFDVPYDLFVNLTLWEHTKPLYHDRQGQAATYLDPENH